MRSRLQLILRCAAFAPLVMAGAAGRAQTTIHTGNCSPVVTGSAGQITIHCSDLSTAKATQLIQLMNKILAEHMDLSEVNSKLDQMQHDLSGINATLNPLAGASAPVRALLAQGETASTQCGTFLLTWSRHVSDAMQKAKEQQAAGTDASSLNEQRSEEFARTFAPRLRSINLQLQAAMPNKAPIPEVTKPKSVLEAIEYDRKLSARALDYQFTMHQQLNVPGDPGGLNLFDQVREFCDEWRMGARNQRDTAQAQASPTAAMHAVEAEEAAQYARDLEPGFLRFQESVLPKIPSFHSDVDYREVRTSMQLTNVCTDISQMWATYRQQAAETLRRSRDSAGQGH